MASSRVDPSALRANGSPLLARYPFPATGSMRTGMCMFHLLMGQLAEVILPRPAPPGHAGSRGNGLHCAHTHLIESSGRYLWQRAEMDCIARTHTCASESRTLI